SPITTGSCSLAGGRCSSRRVNTRTTRQNRRSGIAVPIWSRVWAIAACVIHRSMRSAARRSPRPSGAGSLQWRTGSCRGRALTSNREAGLGDWSMKDIADLLKTGISMRGAVYGPMAEVVHNSLQYLTDEDIRAMGVYLKGIAEHSPRTQPVSPLPSTESSLL